VARNSTDDSNSPVNPRVFLILLAFADGPAHGYEVRKRAEALSKNTIKLDAGSLYRSIAHLLDKGLIEEVEPMPEVETTDSRRRYYTLTDMGRELAAAEAQRLAGLVEHAAFSGLIEIPKVAN
jgi:DNA-binding PadR family transcriptional regulator